MRECAVCGTNKRIIALGGVMLCQEHYAAVSEIIDTLRTAGEPVDVTRIAYRMRKELDGDYLLRDIPRELWQRAKHYAVDHNMSLRQLIITALEAYIKKSQ